MSSRIPARARGLHAGVALLLTATAIGCADLVDASFDDVRRKPDACEPGAVVDCYTGPPETAGIGPCRSGAATCREDGSGFGPCVGEVTPGVEDVELPADESCDGRVGTHLWSRLVGGDGNQHLNGVAVGPADTIVLTGSTGGSFDLGCGAITAPLAHPDAFVAKLDPGGACVWSRAFGSPDESEGGRAVAVDALGNVLVAATVVGPIDFGGGVLAAGGGWDVAVAKLDPDGEHLWSVRYGDGANQQAYGLAVDAEGNVAVTGSLRGTMEVGPGMSLTSGGTDHAFVLVLDAAGSPIFARRFGDQTGVGASVSFGAGGQLHLCGTVQGTVDFEAPGQKPIDAIGAPYAFAATLAPGGDTLWARKLWTSVSSYQTCVVAGAGGQEVVVAGGLTGTSDLGGGPLSSAGGTDVVVARFDGAGQHLWSRLHGDAGDYQRALAVAIDHAGDVLVAGNFEGVLDFGQEPLTGLGDLDVFLLKTSGAGVPLWSRSFGNALPQRIGSLAITTSDEVVLGAASVGAASWGGGALSAGSGENVAITKLAP